MSSKVVKSLSYKFELLRTAVQSGDIVLVTGPPSTGKTSLASWVLEEYPDYLSVYINCNNVVTSSMLYLEILRLLHRKLVGKKGDHKFLTQQVITSVDFIENYQKLHNQAMIKEYERIFIVLDQIQLLKRTPMMEAIVYLTSELNIDFMFISAENGTDILDGIHSNNYRASFQDRLYIVELNPWNKDDLIEAILKELPTESIGLYKKFVHNVVSIVYMSNTKDFVEIRSFCQENFPDFLECYKERIRQIALDEEDEIDLDNVDFDDEDAHFPSPVFTSCLSIFLSSFKDMIRKGEVRDWGRLNVDRKLVLHTAVLIIAAYVAAYTRRADDKKNFISYQKRMSKRAKQDHYENEPKAFTMERLIQIYRGIMILLGNAKENSESLRHDSVLGDVQRLQDLDLISIHSGDGLDSQTRYKISHHVSHHYVMSISQSIDFELDSLTGIPAFTK